jgi:hypothetical protein
LRVNYQNKIRNIQFSSILQEDLMTNRTDRNQLEPAPELNSPDDSNIDDISASINDLDRVITDILI